MNFRFCWVLGILAAHFIATPNVAQDTPDPLRGYSKFEEVEARLKRLESPKVVLSSLGETSGKRAIWLMTIADDPKQVRPAILIVGNVVAPHVLGRELAVRMIEHIVQTADSDPAIKELLSRFTVYVIPSPTPDATEKNFRFPVYEAVGNTSPTDDDRDFAFGEDPPVDLNQDGWITQIRVKEQFGTHRLHATDPRILIPIDSSKRELGEYRLWPESEDTDLDQRFGEDSSAGVVFNRNFTFNYSYFGVGAGPHQVSEIESRAVADFMFDHPNIAAVLCFSLEDNLYHPWKSSSSTDAARIKTKVLSADQRFMDQFAEVFRKLHGGKSAPTPPTGEGSFSEFSYFHFGRWTFASRGWWIPPLDPQKTDEKSTADQNKTEKQDNADKRGADELAALAWLESQGISGFVPWQSIEHPQLPGRQVEVGGFKPFLLLNPPEALIQPLVKPHVSFLSELIRQWPKLDIREVKALDLGNGLYDIRCKIVNTATLPTMPEMGSVNRQWYPIQVLLEGCEGAKMIEGSPRVSVGRLAENGGFKELHWVLLSDSSTKPRFKIHASAPTLHSVEAVVELIQP